MAFKLVSAFQILPANQQDLIKSFIALSHVWAEYYTINSVKLSQHRQQLNQHRLTPLIAINTLLSAINNSHEKGPFDREKTYLNVSHQRQLIHN